MELDVFQNLINKVKDSDLVQNFITELSNHLEKTNSKEGNKMTNNEKVSELNNHRKENCLYQVVDFSSDGVFLQNTNNNAIFEEKNMPKELMDKISNDYILRYKDGNYVIEEELTDDFMNSMVGVQEYKRIQENFEKESNILKIDPNTHYTVSSRNEDFTVLSYGENSKNTIEVPNELLPYFINEQTVLNYKNGKFEKFFND